MTRNTRRAFPTQHPQDVARVVAAEYGNVLTELDQIRTRLLGTGLITATVLSRGSTDTHIASTAFNFHVLGLGEAKAAVTVGTAIGAQTVTANKWALYRLSIAAAGAITVTPAAGNVTGYDTEALAKAAIPATPTNEADMGHLTVKTAVGLAWIAATDALKGGTSGNPASETNYYPNTSSVGDEIAEQITATR